MTKKNKVQKEMSKIHWSIRRKGVPFKSAYKTVGKIKGQSWKFKNKHKYKDYDKDGVVNMFDCQPLNKNRQDGMNYLNLLDKKAYEDEKKLIGSVSSRKEYDLEKDIQKEQSNFKKSTPFLEGKTKKWKEDKEKKDKEDLKKAEKFIKGLGKKPKKEKSLTWEIDKITKSPIIKELKKKKMKNLSTNKSQATVNKETWKDMMTKRIQKLSEGREVTSKDFRVASQEIDKILGFNQHGKKI